jgi:hypothetical protein
VASSGSTCACRRESTAQSDPAFSGMNRIPTKSDLTDLEFAALREVSTGFMSRTIPKGRRARLVELGLIQEVMGGLMATPAGRIVARM